MMGNTISASTRKNRELLISTVDNPRSIATLIYSGVIGASIIFIAPLLVGGMISSRGFTETQAGMLLSMETAGLSFAALFGTLWINKLNWRKVSMVAALLMVFGNIAGFYCDSYFTLLSSRLVCGVGAGSLIALTYGALSVSKKPDRNFGLFSMGQLFFATSALWFLPTVIEEYGLNGIYGFMAVLSILSFSLVKGIPESHRFSSPLNSSQHTHWSYASILLIAILLFFAAQSSIWSYAERMGLFAGFELPQIGMGLAIGAGMGFAGAACATFLNNRFGRFIPILVAISLKLLALVLLLGEYNFALFVILICALKFSWNFIIPFQLGLLSEIEPTGKAAVISSFITGMGLSLGVALAAMVVGGSNYEQVIWVSGACCIASFVLMVIAIIHNRGSSKTPNELSAG